MKIQVRYFASVREQLGAGEQVTLQEDAAGAAVPQTVGQLREWLAGRSPDHAAALSQAKSLRMAFNQTLCAADQALADGAEVAFFPPVTGG
jgi:molybdopterin synthase sulfur carrier subunit